MACNGYTKKIIIISIFSGFLRGQYAFCVEFSRIIKSTVRTNFIVVMQFTKIFFAHIHTLNYPVCLYFYRVLNENPTKINSNTRIFSFLCFFFFFSQTRVFLCKNVTRTQKLQKKKEIKKYPFGVRPRRRRRRAMRFAHYTHNICINMRIYSYINKY